MKPLLAIGLGLVWIVLTTQDTRVDWFPDPVGWGVILLGLPGLRRVAEIVPYWQPLLGLALAALVVSALVWLPAGSRLAEDEPALGWAVNLPGFAFMALLCHGLVAAAGASDDPYSASSITWLRLLEVVIVAVAIAPVLVFGAGWDWLGAYAGGAAQVALLLLTALCFIYANRPWAGAPDDSGAR